jgi:hypothetical protein
MMPSTSRQVTGIGSEATPEHLMMPFLNAFDVIRAIPNAKRFEIGEMLFAQFTCPASFSERAPSLRRRIWSKTFAS